MKSADNIRPISLSKYAVLIGGFSGNPEFIRPLKETLMDPDNGTGVYFEDVKQYTLSEAFEDPTEVARYAKEATLWTHSFGLVAAKDYGIFARSVVALTPPESNRLIRDTAMGAARIAFDRNVKPEPGVSVVPLHHAVREVLRSPAENLRAPFRTRNISSAAIMMSMRNDQEYFNDGLGYVQVDTDYFGFMQEDRVEAARKAGIHTAVLEGTHNSFPIRPREMLGRLTEAMPFERAA